MPESGDSHGSAATKDRRTVNVDLDNRKYEILIGNDLISHAGELIARLSPSARLVIVTDSNIEPLHLPRLKDSISETHQLLGTVVIPSGESSKSYEQFKSVVEHVLELGTERGDILLALGGGVVGDLAGFAASVVRRGIRFVQIPTTLLSQVDSSVGGKTGINSSFGKNLVGAFHQPSLVLADTDALNTLPDRELRAGYVEMAKAGLIMDVDYFHWLEDNWQQVFRDQGNARARAIEIACQAKANIVAADEREEGQRALLNLGHTFGHALEGWAGFSDRLLHGEAISIGIVLAFRLSTKLGLCPQSATDQVTKHFNSIGLPTEIKQIPGETLPKTSELLILMSQDKKVVGGVMTFILVKDIGQAFVTRDVARETVAEFLDEQLSA